MRVRRYGFMAILMILIALPLTVSAQPGGTRPQPSGGGNAGGPGMNGAAYSPSVPELQAPGGNQDGACNSGTLGE